jgi:four helix bundle protein
MGNYRDLSVWNRAHTLALNIYRTTRGFPAEERYGLASQLRRAAVSVVSNIAEGGGRQSDGEQIRFLRIARGSIQELECQLLLSRDLEFISPDVWHSLDAEMQEISKMLHGLIRSLVRRK